MAILWDDTLTAESAPQQIPRGRYSVRVWRSDSHTTAMAGVLSADGTWWPAGVAQARPGQREAIDAAVRDADQARASARVLA